MQGRVFVAALAVWGCVVYADPMQASDVEELLELAGVARAVQPWAEVSLGAREEAQRRLAPESRTLLSREVDTRFAPRALLAALADTASLEIVRSRSLLHGYRENGALGLLGPAEGFGVEDLRAFPDFASRVSGGALDPVRLAQVTRLDEATRFARHAWRVSRAVSRAFHAGTRVLDCQGTDAWTAPSSKQEVQRLRALVVPFRERANVELLFANRDRSAAELGRALRFLEGEAAGRFQEQLSVALDDVIDATLADLGERLETAAEARCPL